MDVIELLKARGLDMSTKIKMLRHQDTRYDVERLYRDGYIEFYQSIQTQNILKCDYVVSFLGQEGRDALFIGVWRVCGCLTYEEVLVPAGFPYADVFLQPGDFYYQLEEVTGFDDLMDRVVIDWGSATRSWHQWLKCKPVVEVLPEGYVNQFPGFLDFVINFRELERLIENPLANKIWHRMLGSVAGIYLVTDTQTGFQYVGSANGKEGILGRWRTYARTGHGNNIGLETLLQSNSGYAANFQFTILRTLPTTLTEKEVIRYENLYKQKLGSLAHGLNMN